MAHLDDDVAAFVDGQLSPGSADAARRHLQDCERCRTAVAQQRQLKARMSLGDVRPPASLLASLSEVPDRPPAPTPGPWRRLRRSGVLAGTAVVGGALAVVMAVAYVVGAPQPGPGDAVVPPVDAFVAQFGSSSTPGDHEVMTTATMARLDANGWPCHASLAQDLERVEGRLQRSAGTVSLVYTDGAARLELHEQNGRLDVDALRDQDPRFFRDEVAGREVWTRQDPAGRVTTWSSDGVVYTIVTDVGSSRLAQAMAMLPAPRERPGPADRVGQGLARVSSWISAL